jgi:hypothetical protein
MRQFVIGIRIDRETTNAEDVLFPRIADKKPTANYMPLNFFNKII